MFNDSSEKYYVIAFVLTIAIVLGLFTYYTVKLLRYYVKYRRYQNLSKFAKFILLIGSLGIMAMFYGYFIEPYWLEVKFVKLTSPKIKNPIRIVQISDIHCDKSPRLEPIIPETISNLHPDIIVFTGDSINSKPGLPIFQTLMRKLAIIAPIYAVRGNWDISTRHIPYRFKELPVTELNNLALTFKINDNLITLAGKPTSSKILLGSILADTNPDAYKIFLYHYPDSLIEASLNNIDLYLAGHTHGGQVALPFYGAIITASKFKKKYESGLYRLNNTYLYINRGIGMEGESAPRVRFCARPEITVIDIKNQP